VLNETPTGVFFSGRSLVETINGGISGIDQARLNVTGTGLFFSGRTIAQEINTGATNIEQRRLAVTGNEVFANGLTIVGNINAGAGTVNGSHVDGVLTLVTGITRTNVLQTFASGGTSFFQPILAGATVNVGTYGARFLTGYFSTIESFNYQTGGVSGVSGSFKSGDLSPKTITVTNGIITGIF
jgi:hypothetical protein